MLQLEHHGHSFLCHLAVTLFTAWSIIVCIPVSLFSSQKSMFGIRYMCIPWKWMWPKKPDFSVQFVYLASSSKHNCLQTSQFRKRKWNGKANSWCELCFCNTFAFVCHIDESLWEFWLVYIHVPNGPGLQKARAPGKEKASQWNMHNIFTRCSRAVCFAVLEWWCPDIFISSNLVPVFAGKQLYHSQVLWCWVKVSLNMFTVAFSCCVSKCKWVSI